MGAFIPSFYQTSPSLPKSCFEPAIGPTEWLIPIVVFFAIFVGGYAIDIYLYTILHPSEYSNTKAYLVYLYPLCVIPIGSIFAAIIAIPLHRAWRRHRLSKTHITVRHFVCRQCKNEWTVTQEPVSPASHESESAPAVTAPSLPAEGAIPAHQTALPAPLLSPPTRGQTKRRRSPAGTVSLILLALILLGGISFGIYYVVTRSPFGTSSELSGVAWSGSQFVVVVKEAAMHGRCRRLQLIDFVGGLRLRGRTDDGCTEA